MVNAAAATRRLVLCSATPDGFAERRQALGDTRADLLARELALFVRRLLRGVDAVAIRGDELCIMLDAPSGGANAVANRLTEGVRNHSFSAGSSGPAVRLTLALGLAYAPEHGVSFLALDTLARQARLAAGEDCIAVAYGDTSAPLMFNRFVGRAERVTSLIDCFDDAVRGAGHVAAVIGDRGVGASTLVRAIQPEVRLRGGSLIVASCRPRMLPSPYALWSDVLRAVRRLPVKTTRQWRHLPLLDPSLERADATPASSSKQHLLEELADFLRLAAQQRPLVILLENMQWSDDASWDALEYLITQLERERIFIALTIQQDSGSDVSLERWTPLAGKPRHHEIRVGYLTRDEAKRWLEATLHTTDVAREVMSYIYRQSEGRPLALTHLLRDLEEAGHLARDGSAWRWSAVADLPAIGSLEDLLARRVSRLPAGAHAALEMASVLDREGSETLLLGGAPEASRADLALLVERGFLVSTFDRESAAYVVSHTEVAKVVQDRLAPERATELHARVARALAAQSLGAPSEIAEHFERAGILIMAHQYALQAAERASSLHETGAVAALLTAAERTAPNEAALADVRVRMVSVAEVAGRYEEATALCDAALEWYESQADQLNSLRLKRTRALVRLKRGQGATETLAELRALEAEARAAGADMERAAVLLLMAQLHYRLGNSLEAQSIAAEAVGIAEHGGDPMLLADASNRFGVTIQLIDAPRARELFNRSLELATSIGDTSRIVRALSNLGVLEMINNNMDASREALTTAIELARTGGMIEPWAMAELNLGVLAGRMGDYAIASQAFSESLRLSAIVQNSEYQLCVLINLANLERDHERFREAGDTYELTMDLAERIGQASVQAGAVGGFGLCRRILGDVPVAREALGRSLALTDAIDEWFQGRELVAALKLHFMIEEGQIDAAVALFDESLGLASAIDPAGAAFLVAEFGAMLMPHAPDLINEAVSRYADLPDVLYNSKMRERFSVLKTNTKVPY